jgi:putative addiction module component (TIGR02574 family)
LVDDLWDSITLEEEGIPVPKSHLDELEIRLKEYKSNPGRLLSIEELQAKIKKS